MKIVIYYSRQNTLPENKDLFLPVQSGKAISDLNL
jgi:hypothetical protein